MQTLQETHCASTVTATRPLGADAARKTSEVPLDHLASALEVGDLVFIRVTLRPFREVATATGSWTNHVGIVVDVEGEEVLIGESTFPMSRTTTLSRFVGRSKDGRVGVARLAQAMTTEQQRKVKRAVRRRTGILYDRGFNLHSRRQFCSRFVREVLEEATGAQVGEIETFGELLRQRPGIDLRFWQWWYFGQIPWSRETVTPASVMHSAALRRVFNGYTTLKPSTPGSRGSSC